jgi:hypothetical protein
MDMCTKISSYTLTFRENAFETFKRLELLNPWIEKILSLTVNNIILCINLG